MKRVPMMDCGDGVLRADNGSVGKLINQKTGVALSASQAGAIITNKGCTGTVSYLLPKPAIGMWFMFVKQTAFTLNIQATNGAKIADGLANKLWQNVAAETIASFKIFSPDGVDWLVDGSVGTWVKNDTLKEITEADLAEENERAAEALRKAEEDERAAEALRLKAAEPAIEKHSRVEHPVAEAPAPKPSKK